MISYATAIWGFHYFHTKIGGSHNNTNSICGIVIRQMWSVAQLIVSFSFWNTFVPSNEVRPFFNTICTQAPTQYHSSSNDRWFYRWYYWRTFNAWCCVQSSNTNIGHRSSHTTNSGMSHVSKFTFKPFFFIANNSRRSLRAVQSTEENAETAEDPPDIIVVYHCIHNRNTKIFHDDFELLSSRTQIACFDLNP